MKRPLIVDLWAVLCVLEMSCLRCLILWSLVEWSLRWSGSGVGFRSRRFSSPWNCDLVSQFGTDRSCCPEVGLEFSLLGVQRSDYNLHF